MFHSGRNSIKASTLAQHGDQMKPIVTQIKHGIVTMSDCGGTRDILLTTQEKATLLVSSQYCRVKDIFSPVEGSVHPRVNSDFCAKKWSGLASGIPHVDKGVKAPYYNGQGGGVGARCSSLGNMPSNTFINRLSLPGSHDSGSRVAPGQTQAYSIINQLRFVLSSTPRPKKDSRRRNGFFGFGKRKGSVSNLE